MSAKSCCVGSPAGESTKREQKLPLQRRVCHVARWIVSCLSKSVCLSFTADDRGDACRFQRTTSRAYANCPGSARYCVASCSQCIDAAACRSGSVTRKFAGETQIKSCS